MREEIEERETKLDPVEEEALAKYPCAVLSLVVRVMDNTHTGREIGPDVWARIYLASAAEIIGIASEGRPFDDVLRELAARLVERGPDEQDIQLRITVKQLARRLYNAR